MKKGFVRMEKRPGISVIRLLSATKMKIITTGAYNIGEGLELKFRARVRLDDCLGCSDTDEKVWHAQVLELYPEGGSKCQQETQPGLEDCPTANLSRNALKDQIREKLRNRTKELQQSKKEQTPSATRSPNTPPPVSPVNRTMKVEND